MKRKPKFILASQSPRRQMLLKRLVANFQCEVAQVDETASRHLITHLFVTTKAHQAIEAIQAYQAHIDPKATVILLQNGMGVANQVSALLPSADILVGITTEGANRGAPFILRHAGIGTTWLGRLPPKEADPIQLAPIAALKKAGFDVHWDPNIEKRLWLKLAINCAINGLAVLYDCCNGELLRQPKAKTELDSLIAEITACFEIIKPELANNLKANIYQVIEDTATNICSTLQDWRKGASTELDYINGFLITYSETKGINLPLNKKIVQTVKTKRYR